MALSREAPAAAAEDPVDALVCDDSYEAQLLEASQQDYVYVDYCVVEAAR